MIFKVSKLVLSLDFRKCSTIAHLLSDQGTHHKLGHINRKTLNLSNMNHGQPLLMIIRRRHSYGLYLLRWLWPLHNVAIAISEFISCICIALCLLCCGLPSVFFFFSFPSLQDVKDQWVCHEARPRFAATVDGTIVRAATRTTSSLFLLDCCITGTQASIRCSSEITHEGEL